MPSFATGIVCAVVLAGCTWWAMQAGTVTVVEKWNDVSTIIGTGQSSAFREPAAAKADPDGA